MNRPIQATMILFVMGVAVFAACSKKDKPVEYEALGEFVEAQDSFPRVRYFDTNLVSINDRCAVRKVKLSTKMPAVYVNGQPVGFC
jgi:hypothetical protein